VAELISVIVATYNRQDALDAVLRGLSRQSDQGFEVVVADDGSGRATADLVARWKGSLDIPLIHVWHEDRGFRLAEIRNRAIRACRGSYCIFLDGDCIPRMDFVAAHRRLAEPGWFVAGNRVLLSSYLTSEVLEGGLEPERWNFVDWIAARLRGQVNRLVSMLSLPLGPLRKLQPDHWQTARGGNVAIAKRDLIAIDGFEAAYRGWGREDSDIFIRLVRSGVRRKSGGFATAVLHLWHRENDRSQLAENDARLSALITNERTRAEQGLSILADGGSMEEIFAVRDWPRG
jgi:glycosyltransferase involved in cell wall biosynthesis